MKFHNFRINFNFIFFSWFYIGSLYKIWTFIAIFCLSHRFSPTFAVRICVHLVLSSCTIWYVIKQVFVHKTTPKQYYSTDDIGTVIEQLWKASIGATFDDAASILWRAFTGATFDGSFITLIGRRWCHHWRQFHYRERLPCMALQSTASLPWRAAILAAFNGSFITTKGGLWCHLYRCLISLLCRHFSDREGQLHYSEGPSLVPLTAALRREKMVLDVNGQSSAGSGRQPAQQPRLAGCLV